MMASQSTGRRGLLWAILGGLVLAAGIVALIVSSLMSQPSPQQSASPRTLTRHHRPPS